MIAKDYTLGIDIGSTTVKIAILDPDHKLLFADYRRHHADIRGTLFGILTINCYLRITAVTTPISAERCLTFLRKRHKSLATARSIR